jgi:hypothetical protein
MINRCCYTNIKPNDLNKSLHLRLSLTQSEMRLTLLSYLNCKGFFTITGKMWVSWNMRFTAYLYLVIWFRTHKAMYNTYTPTRNGATRNNGTYISYKGFRRKRFWLCWREHKFLDQSPMPHRSKSRGQIKCSPWSYKLGVGHGASNITPGKSTVKKPQAPMEEAKTHIGL